MATLRTYNATVGSFSPLLHLRLNEASGTTAFDSADDLDGEYRGGFTLRADGPIGNGAVGLDGSTGYVFVPHQDQLLLSSGSFELWFTADEVSGDHTLFAKNSAGFGTGGQIAGLIRDGKAFVALGDLTTNYLVVGDDPDDAKVQAGVSAHMVFTFGPQGMELYLNGQLVDTNPYTGGLELGTPGTGNLEPLVLGTENGTNAPGTPIDQPGDLIRFFDGTIDEFVIYDQALSQAQVQRLFQAGEQGLQLAGTADDDTLIGGLDDEILIGRAGNDSLRGAGGNDALRGGGGADDLLGGAGNDDLSGGGGGDDLRGGPGADALDGMGGNDLIIGGSGDDLLQGGAGRDTLSGSGGADELFGGRGIDPLSGGAGDDLLNGGPGRDGLTGGAGSDTFQIDRISHGVDRIGDFEDGPGGDVLDLSAVLDFGGADDFNDFVRLSATDTSTRVEVNRDGSGNDFTAVFNLLGTTGLDLATLVSDGNIQLSPPDS
jgi:Ca2+-binding RTX toxin-like protein